MANPITRLLSRIDGELGRTKTGVRPPPNLVQFFSGEELNNAFDAIESLLAIVGLSDGTTAGSVLRKLRSFSGPRDSAFVVLDDFIGGQTPATSGSAYRLTSTAGGTAAIGVGDAGTGSGVGHALVAVPDVATAAAAFGIEGETITGAHLPDLRFRFKTPAAQANCDWALGLSDLTSATRYARLGSNNGVLSIQSASVILGGAASTIVAATLADSTWYEGRIRFVAGAIEFYVDDVLIGTVSTAAAIPHASDYMSPLRMSLARDASGAHTLICDWYELTGTRA